MSACMNLISDTASMVKEIGVTSDLSQSLDLLSNALSVNQYDNADHPREDCTVPISRSKKEEPAMMILSIYGVCMYMFYSRTL